MTKWRKMSTAPRDGTKVLLVHSLLVDFDDYIEQHGSENVAVTLSLARFQTSKEIAEEMCLRLCDVPEDYRPGIWVDDADATVCFAPQAYRWAEAPILPEGLTE